MSVHSMCKVSAVCSKKKVRPSHLQGLSCVHQKISPVTVTFDDDEVLLVGRNFPLQETQRALTTIIINSNLEG